MGVIKNTKKFSKEDLEENDAKAKRLALHILNHFGYTLETPIEDQPEAYKDWDFIVQYKGIDIPIEVERKRVWSGGGFPYDTIDVPYRKKDTKSKLFVMVNNECNAAAISLTREILESEVKVKNTTYTSGEKFFAVPLSRWRFYDLSRK